MSRAHTIDVRETANGDPRTFKVTIRESGAETRHTVTLAKIDYERLTDGRATPEQLVEAAFCFLLDREPKESILGRFDLTVIWRYFPEFERELPRYLANASSSHKRSAP